MRNLMDAGMLRVLQLLLCLSAPALAACGGDDGTSPVDPEPLAVTAASPADGANDVETGAQVTATFNRGIEPATLTPENFVLRAGGTQLGSIVAYDAATHAARLVGPLLPQTFYEVELTTGIRDDEGGALSAAQEWTFTTRPWQTVLVDQGGGVVGTYNSLAVDGNGRPHISYWDFIDGDLEYATCVAGCTTAANWTTTTVDATGYVGLYTSLAIDGNGGLHLIYHASTTGDLKYATCVDACFTSANWSTVAVDTAGIVGRFGSLTVGENGRLHASYYHFTNSELRYATCGAGCTTAANWTSVGVDQAGGNGSTTSIAVDGTGRLHVGYHDSNTGDLKYATCSGGCTTGTNWTAITVVAAGSENLSLEVDGSGAVHVSYQGEDHLRYASCPGQCGTASNWTTLAVDTAGGVGGHPSLVVDGSGRRHVSYYDHANGDLKYATCAAGCTAAESWQSAAVDQVGDVGSGSSLAVDGSGRVHVSYHDATDGGIRYIE